MTAVATGAGRRPTRVGRPVALVVVGLLLVAVAVGAPGEGRGDPLSPAGTGRAGARGLVLLLEALGADVEVVRGPPPDEADTAIVLADLLTEDDTDATVRWVRRGGVLVVADPGSPLADGGVEPPCPAAIDAVQVLEVDLDDEVGRGEGRPGSCFDGIVRSVAVGDGDIVAVAGAAVFTNELLGEDDNAVLAASLLAPAPGTRVAFVVGPSVAPTGEQPALVELVGTPVRDAAVLAEVAVLLWAAWRARRLGRPVVEEQPVAVAGSELVVAVGRLLDARRRPDEAAQVLRGDVRRAVGARLGLPADADVRVVAAAVADRGGIDHDRAAAALGERAVATDDDLLAVAADLDRIRTDVLGSRPP